MLGKLGDISKMMGQLKEMQAQMEQSKKRLDAITVKGKDQKATVSIELNGNKNLVNIDLTDQFESLSKEEKQFALFTAFNEAMKAAENVHESEMRGAAGSMMPNLGGMFTK